MIPRLVFLGTGGDCEVIGRYRTAAGILLQTDNIQLHIDPGPGALVRLFDYGLSARKHTAVLASSADLNHSHDLPAIISAMTLNGLDSRGVLIAPKSVLKGSLPQSFQRMCREVCQAEPGKKFSVENAEVACLKTVNNNHNVGFRVLTPEFSFTYTSDTGFSKELINDYKSEILILNTVSYERSKRTKQQLSVPDALKIISKVKPKLAILTHFGQKFHKQNPIYAARELSKQTGVQVVAAEDGMIFDTLSYSAKPAQKTLRRFTQAP